MVMTPLFKVTPFPSTTLPVKELLEADADPALADAVAPPALADEEAASTAIVSADDDDADYASTVFKPLPPLLRPAGVFFSSVIAPFPGSKTFTLF
ncbi:hypothetical protein DPMN_030640 [Dreissena polymorpha]|uniref:Uncharacterized protein n=1 Tax=Dreissena polymorpha TaxID=45954 RepID=A0A9D4RGC3_DREPO|nr:hypothetical protein DPMN_030640 [Dreissena polymorpha]